MESRDDEFKRRLERISQSRSEQAPPPSARPASRAPGRSVVGLIVSIVSYIAIPLVMFVALPWYILSNLPALTAMLNLPTLASGIEGSAKSADKAEVSNFSVRFDRLGAEYGDDHVANAEAKPLTLAEVTASGLATGPETPVKDIALFDANADCRLRRPADAEKVVNVSVRGSGIEAPVRAIDAAPLQEFLERRVDKALSEGETLDLKEINRGIFGVVDVYVTDTSAPLYLVLQSFSGNTVWNLHAAPGVNISHVAMVSGGASGLAGDVGSASFEAIRASDFGDPADAGYGGNAPDPKAYDCMAWPFQQPNESWSSWQGSKDGNTMDGNLLFGQSHGYDAYEHFYRRALGVTPGENAVTTAFARAALAGPLPATPVAFATAEGLQLRLMRHDHVFTGTTEERETKFVGHYQTILATAAGGDRTAISRAEIDLVTDPAQAAPAEVAVEGDDGGFLIDLVLAGTPWEQGFNAMIDMTNSNYERRVGFDQDLPLESMLAEGEAMPPEDQRLLYAMMRAPAAVEHHCRETLVEIAIRCRLLKSSVRLNEKGTYSVDATFGYVPNYAIGALEKKSGWGFVSAFLPDRITTKALDTPEKRTAFLRRLEKVCDELRAETGTCVISTAGFYLERAANFSGGGDPAWAAGWVSVYAPDNPFEEEKLQKRAEVIWEQTR